MAKPKVTPCRDWNEVDQDIKRLGEIAIAIEDAEGEMTLKINEIKAEYKNRTVALATQRKELESRIAGFTEENKDLFVGGRTKELNFGKVSYRVTKSIRIASKASCLAALKALNLAAYIRTKEEPDKDAMAGLDDNTLIKVSASRKVEDKLLITPDIERIKDCA